MSKKAGVSQDASDSGLDDRFLRSSSIMTKVVVKSDLVHNENFGSGVIFSPYQARQSSIILNQEPEERPNNEAVETTLIGSAETGLNDGAQRHSTSFGRSLAKPVDDSVPLVSSADDLVRLTVPQS